MNEGQMNFMHLVSSYVCQIYTYNLVFIYFLPSVYDTV